MLTMPMKVCMWRAHTHAVGAGMGMAPKVCMSCSECSSRTASQPALTQLEPLRSFSAVCRESGVDTPYTRLAIAMPMIGPNMMTWGTGAGTGHGQGAWRWGSTGAPPCGTFGTADHLQLAGGWRGRATFGYPGTATRASTAPNRGNEQAHAHAPQGKGAGRLHLVARVLEVAA